MAVTIKDVARRAGVSHPTVSMSFAGDPRISPATRDKVLRVARAMKYVPNLAARHLRRGVSNLIGFIVNDITDPFYAIMVQVAEATAVECGYQLIIADSQWDPEREVAAVRRMNSFRVRGLLLCSTEQTRGGLDLLAETQTPVVVVDACPPWHKGCFIGNDVRAAGELAATHLLDVGCRNPVFLTASRALLTFSGFEAMRQGFCQVLRKRRMAQPERRVVPAGLTIEEGRDAFHRVRTSVPDMDGVFCANDLCALGVMTGADEAGLCVGRDLVVMGVDDLAVARLPRIGLTSIHQPHEQIARTAAHVLIESLEAGVQPSLRQLFQPELVIRKSSRLKGA